MLAFLVYNLCVLYVIYKNDSFANVKKMEFVSCHGHGLGLAWANICG